MGVSCLPRDFENFRGEKRNSRLETLVICIYRCLMFNDLGKHLGVITCMPVPVDVHLSEAYNLSKAL